MWQQFHYLNGLFGNIIAQHPSDERGRPATHINGVSRGRSPYLTGFWGVPQNISYPPFLTRKGGRGMVESQSQIRPGVKK